MSQLPAKLLLLSFPATALLLASCATTTPMEEASAAGPFSLGRNAPGEPCTAVVQNADRAIINPQDATYLITCRSEALAGRPFGYVRRVVDRPAEVSAIEATLTCGEPSRVSVAGLGNVEARRCFDATLGQEALALVFDKRGRRFIGTATPSAVANLEEALRIVSGATRPSEDANRTIAGSVNYASLAAAPLTSEQAQASSDFDARAGLEQGIRLNHRGQHIEASRILNDTLSRIPESASPTLRAELLLEAALADSNIGFTQPSAEHFARAEAILASEQVSDKALLQRKHDIYLALDALNRRNWRTAIQSLEKVISARADSRQPLQDLAVIGQLNQPQSQGSGGSGLLSSPGDALVQQLMLDAQANWARSVALRALGDRNAAERVLVEAEQSFAPLRTERYVQGPLLWLSARLERQRARLAADKGNWESALRSYDKAIDDLRRSAVGSAGTENEPAVVEAQLERATVLARRGDAPAQVRREFDQAIDTLIASRFTGAAVPAGVDRYLELLIAEVKAQPSEDAYNRFFQAMQAVGEPAVARQINKLQAVMTSDPAIGAKFRDRADLEREITRLRYQITSADPATAAELNRQRQTAETKLLSLNAELQNSRLDEAPATVAEVRAALQPDESFLKIAELNRKLYGIAITKDQTFIYAIEPAARFLDAVATELRNSIDGRLGQDKRLVSFNVQAAHSLFKALTGPASARLMQSRALVIDPAGPLSRIPAGVLITDAASVQRYNARRRKDPFNYSDLSFLASQMKIGTAVSPRSFLSLRALPASKGVNPFIGFAEHVPPTTGPQFASAAKIDVGDACSAEFTELRALAQRLRPIDRKEVTIASSALGLPNAPVVAGDEFSDTAIKSRGDLAQYKVLHFATHGLQEGVWGCDRSPPALVTSFGDKNSDGLLSFSEIAELNLDANLVVLSACDTGSGIRNQALARQSGQEEAGATLEGLVRAFLTANSRAVLATHWQVSAEEETDQLIRTFYSTALQQDIGSSLQAAQRQLLKNPRYSHPFYWGAYFVVGDNSKMMLGS